MCRGGPDRSRSNQLHVMHPDDAVFKPTPARADLQGNQTRKCTRIVTGVAYAVSLQPPREHSRSLGHFKKAHAPLIAIGARVTRCHRSDPACLRVRAGISACRALREAASDCHRAVCVIDRDRKRARKRAIFCTVRALAGNYINRRQVSTRVVVISQQLTPDILAHSDSIDPILKRRLVRARSAERQRPDLARADERWIERSCAKIRPRRPIQVARPSRRCGERQGCCIKCGQAVRVVDKKRCE